MKCQKISKLQVSNFRNLKNDLFEFTPGINCILGENGNGKTNLLEAIHLITNKKSFRKNTDFPQLINLEGNIAEIIIQSVFEQEEEKSSYSIRISETNEERYWNNQLEKKKTPAVSVFINPFDSYSFHHSSSFRRNWIDTQLGLINSEYKMIFNRFQKALRFRNGLLSGPSYGLSHQLKAIDEQISEYSAFITQKRADFYTELNQFITPTFAKIFSEDHKLTLELDSLFLQWDAKKIYDFYRHQEETDIKHRITKIGVHRDDHIFYFDGLNAFEFCSLGQQKMAFLSLVFAYIELFRYKFTSYPLVLIDDVSGELDSHRWHNLIRYLKDRAFQVFITTANENFRKELELIPNSRKFLIKHGSLTNHE
jgi:DNA replication and repair protein RecF